MAIPEKKSWNNRLKSVKNLELLENISRVLKKLEQPKN